MLYEKELNELLEKIEAKNKIFYETLSDMSFDSGFMSNDDL